MATVDVVIGKRNFQVKCGDGQEPHVRSLARKVTERVETLSTQLEGSNEAFLLAMTALMLQDELNDLHNQLDVLRKTGAIRPGTLPNVPQQPPAEEVIIEALNAVSDYVTKVTERVDKRTPRNSA